jgi:hypothetical protein
MSASENWTITMIELPGVIESGMPGRNGQRKPGTAHSGDCDRPFQPKVITDSGDRDHVLTRPTEAA